MATFMSLLSFLLYNDSRVYKLTKAITYTRSKINFVLLKFILWLLRAVDDKLPEWRFSLHASSMCAGGTVNGFVGWSRNDIARSVLLGCKPGHGAAAAVLLLSCAVHRLGRRGEMRMRWTASSDTICNASFLSLNFNCTKFTIKVGPMCHELNIVKYLISWKLLYSAKNLNLL